MYVVTLPPSANPTEFAAQAKTASADILEIRGDLTPNLTPFHCDLPILFSPRGKNQKLIEVLQPQFLDLELQETCNVKLKTCKLIRSYHNYEKTPSLKELQQIATDLATDADIVKIAVQINTFADLVALDKLEQSLPNNQKRVILGMGPKAHLNRLRSPLRNALTYTYLDDGEQAAAGQVPLSIYKQTSHLKQPKLFGLLGSPDVQSLGPVLHNTLYHSRNVDALYSLFLTDDLADAWENLTKLGVKGFSVTAPFKQEIIPYLDELSDDARALGTVNTVVKKNNKWIGYPRDSEGLMRGYPCLRESHSVAIVGSGGVVPSVIHACRESGVADITIYARNEMARKELSEKFSCQEKSLSDLENDQSDTCIYAIPSDTSIALPKLKTYNLKPTTQHAIDLRYGKQTSFLQQAKQIGYITHDGLAMFIHQALAQAELFAGIQTTDDDVQLFYSLLS